MLLSFEKKGVYKEPLQGDGPLPQNNDISRVRSQHVQHNIFSHRYLLNYVDGVKIAYCLTTNFWDENVREK